MQLSPPPCSMKNTKNKTDRLRYNNIAVFMITEEQFAAIKRLIVSENCMIDRFEHYVSEIKEPQLKEDMQKLTAALKNQRSGLLTSLEDNNGN